MGLLKNLFKKDKNDNLVAPNDNVNLNSSTNSLGKASGIIEQIEAGGCYHLQDKDESLDIYKNHAEYVKKLYGDTKTIVKYDVSDLASFQLERVENSFRGAWNTLQLHYYAYSGAAITKMVSLPYNKEKKSEIEIIAKYLDSKLGAKREYDDQQKELAKQREYERIHGKIRYSKYEFPFFDDNYYLKYSYYDVDVKGIEFQEFDIGQIAIDSDVAFIKEPTNEYDKNAIQIRCHTTSIGYVPNNKLQSMIHDYMRDNDAKIVAFISKVDEEAKTIQIAIGFYRCMTNKELRGVLHIDAGLVKTSKKDELGNSRQDNLGCVSEGDFVEVDYQYDSGTYLVTDDTGNELGEINESKSIVIQGFENEGKTLHGFVLETGINDSGKYACKVRIIAVNN